MSVFFTTLEQLALLFSFILLGYVLARKKIVPDNTHGVLSKLESWVFMPCLVMSSFMDNFTPEKLSAASKLFAGSFALTFLIIGLSVVLSRLLSKDSYEKNLFAYGLSFSSFGFIGNAIVAAMFPDLLLEYIIFTLPFWIMIYLWGVPVLLMGDSAQKATAKQRLKNLLNPMFICMLIGMVVGLAKLPIPRFLQSAVASAGSCMSPLAMLLTGMAIAHFRLGDILKIKSVYYASALRLVVLPLLFLVATLCLPISDTFATCGVVALSMPLGLNTLVIPASLGKDTRLGAGMALVSHIVSCITIPAIFALFALTR